MRRTGLLLPLVSLLVPAPSVFPRTAAADGQTEPYSESLRPQFHFTYRAGWLSDINGPFYHKGEYHLFTQHCPGGPGLSYP